MSTQAFIDRLRDQQVPWLPEQPRSGAIALSCRLRLARNIVGFPFPHQLNPSTRRQVQLLVARAVSTIPPLNEGFQASLVDLDIQQRQMLAERRLTDSHPADQLDGITVYSSADETLTLTVNEVDHTRLWLVKPGLDLASMWKQLAVLDTQLSNQLDITFHASLGYLTARPSDVGTGLRAAVLLHLPALSLAEQLPAVVRAIEAMGLAIEPLYFDETYPIGNLFELTNGGALGETEVAIIERVHRTASALVQRERDARQMLASKHPDLLADAVGRAYGVLRHGYRLGPGEALSLLSAIRLGIDLGMVETLDHETINTMQMLSQTGHLRAAHPGSADGDGQEALRASILRDHLLKSDSTSGRKE